MILRRKCVAHLLSCSSVGYDVVICVRWMVCGNRLPAVHQPHHSAEDTMCHWSNTTWYIVYFNTIYFLFNDFKPLIHWSNHFSFLGDVKDWWFIYLASMFVKLWKIHLICSILFSEFEKKNCYYIKKGLYLKQFW